jgi:hypothetical protein
MDGYIWKYIFKYVVWGTNLCTSISPLYQLRHPNGNEHSQYPDLGF